MCVREFKKIEKVTIKVKIIFKAMFYAILSCSWQQSELNCTNLWRVKSRGISVFALHALKVKKIKINNCHVFFVLLNIFMRLVSICTQLSMKSSCVIPWPTFHGLWTSREWQSPSASCPPPPQPMRRWATKPNATQDLPRSLPLFHYRMFSSSPPIPLRSLCAPLRCW